MLYDIVYSIQCTGLGVVTIDAPTQDAALEQFKELDEETMATHLYEHQDIANVKAFAIHETNSPYDEVEMLDKGE